MAALSMKKLSSLRTILRHVRHNNGNAQAINKSPTYAYIMEQYRKNSVTDAQYCQEQQEMAFIAETYATYLDAGLRYKELYDEFHHPERTVEETARMVGFKLPHDPE
ncbi:protein FMC1 homolog [Hyalella azteca]|uniref:Protein FMC1 homolog n=1 Tax=Hyalella azteca TaxID=294128 RepID=A0A8B7NDC8_HYAAZ|nr:protein FMC1 homolog [Hyalella azteca]